MNHAENEPLDPRSDSAPSWFEKKENVNLLVRVLVAVCILLVVADFFYVNPHKHFETSESIFGFHAVFGFVAFVSVVFIGKALRTVLKREEDYYDS